MTDFIVPTPAEASTPKVVLSRLADIITESIPVGFGFSLLVFPAGGEGPANYISNCRREDMIKVLREKANILEQGLEYGLDETPIQDG